jgi:DMSO reductase family type II enzyme chaperone
MTQVERSIARSRMYALLAEGFRYPDAETHSGFADGAYAASLADALGERAPDQRLRVADPLVDLAAAYLSAFETDIPEPSASLYEGTYRQQGQRPALLLELKGFYRNFGLEMGDAANDLEDTVTAELEFMQFLAAKQAQAQEGSLPVVPYVRAQRDFLERHLAQWLPELRKDIAAKVKHPFYVALGELASEFVARDLEAVRRELSQH